ncbi:MAG: hypothetical protein HYY17_06785, partial [Planctomycetes bacterium]|nr:hypothetical protein [Planctomycetota bacterium]
MILLMLALGVLAGDDEEKLKSEIRDLRRELRRTLDRLDELERKVAALDKRRPSQEEKRTPPKQDPLDEPAKWNELTVGKGVKFELYGFLRLDAIYDDSRPNNSQIISSVRSEDPAAPSSIGADSGDDDLTIHPRLTRLGIDFDGPKVDPLGGAKLDGKFEIDFYNLVSGTITSNSREFIRMRHAWLKLAWERFSVLAGQREDVISPIFPVVNPDFTMWGAGNLGDRRPQIRPEWSNGTFTATGMIGLTGADDGQDADGDGILDGEDSSLPTLQARFGLSIDGWVEKQRIAAGAWGHWAREETSLTLAGERKFDSWAFGLDLTLPILANLWFKGELWTGSNLDDVRGGILQGINATTGDEIASTGGWAELGWKPLDWYAVSLGFAIDDPVSDDL